MALIGQRIHSTCPCTVLHVSSLTLWMLSSQRVYTSLSHQRGMSLESLYHITAELHIGGTSHTPQFISTLHSIPPLCSCCTRSHWSSPASASLADPSQHTAAQRQRTSSVSMTSALVYLSEKLPQCRLARSFPGVDRKHGTSNCQ